jgi:hypothetical protein
MSAKTGTSEAPKTTQFSAEDIAELLTSNRALQSRLEKLESNNQGGVNADLIKEIFAQNQQGNADLIKTLQKAFPEVSETDYNAITDLNPDGEKVLQRGVGELMHQDAQGREREVYWHTTLDWRQQTPEEIRAWNKIQSDCESRNGRWTARIIRDGGTKPGGRLLVKTSDNSRDARASMPSELAVALELGGGRRTVDLYELQRLVDAQQKEIESLKSGASVAKR